MPGVGGVPSPFVPSFLPVNRIIYVPRVIHDLPSRTFLDFALEDAKHRTLSGRVNALVGAKRAVSSRVDTLLYATGLSRLARDNQWTFEKRLAALAEVGYATPAGLDAQINKPRNLIEHQYRFGLTPLQLRDALSLSLRYLDITEKYVELGFIRAAEFSRYRVHDPRSSLRRPRREATVLLFDYDLDIMDCYSGRGVHVAKPFRDLGTAVLVSIFQALVHAAAADPSLRVGLRSEAAFLRMMR
jgi:hypothetical protein